MIRVLFILGTRPEAIKLAPLILHQKTRPEQFHVTVCATGQHRDLLDQVLQFFGISPEFDLDVMRPGQTLCQSSARILAGLEKAVASAEPNMVVVQGDTTSTLCGALAAFYRKIPVAHVEAGLRTGDVNQPFPEELNRVLTARMASLHFAPTDSALENLVREGCAPESVFLTGNSGIDAVLAISNRLASGEIASSRTSDWDSSKKLILVTAHRRENFGAKLESICQALAHIAKRPDVRIVFPVHPNPEVRSATRILSGLRNVQLLDPLSYVEFVELMRSAYFLVTDSGGIQEEATSLGKPVLLLREKTERMEGVLSGNVVMVGSCRSKIVAHATELLESGRTYRRMAKAQNLYGDGKASHRISESILDYFGEESLRFRRSCAFNSRYGSFQPMSKMPSAAQRLAAAAQQLSRTVTAWTRRFSPADAS
jgi:UDP-N-acetylglucosamine 2-epimerase (non-hydrolysing)